MQPGALSRDRRFLSLLKQLPRIGPPDWAGTLTPMSRIDKTGFAERWFMPTTWRSSSCILRCSPRIRKTGSNRSGSLDQIGTGIVLERHGLSLENGANPCWPLWNSGRVIVVLLECKKMVARADGREPVFARRADCSGTEFGDCAFHLHALLGKHGAEARLAGMETNRSRDRDFSSASPADNLLRGIGFAFWHNDPPVF